MITEQWDIHEITLDGPSHGNPFLDVTFSARFTCGGTTVDVPGFYDGDGTYKVRFMPQHTGAWTWQSTSDTAALNGRIGAFDCVPPTGGNHGPVRVHNTYHFQYSDTTPYKPLGTTAYVWTYQGEDLAKETLDTLAAAPFNKIRFCVLPKHYPYNAQEPDRYPFARTMAEGTEPDDRPAPWDPERFDPAFFHDFEHRIAQVRDLGIEADIILFHPYDSGRWGFDRMDAATDDRYLCYVVARLAAYRNVWWSIANEYDMMTLPMYGVKAESDFDRYAQVVHDSDPYGHLLSVHNWHTLYDHNKPWVTHASIQGGPFVEDPVRASLLRQVYRKPLVFDEVKYEGDIPEDWGNITGQELVHRFWNATVASAYASHGETLQHPQDVLWWAKGGVLHGDSPARLQFLNDVLGTAPADGLEPIPYVFEPALPIVGKEPDYFLTYFGKDTPAVWTFHLPQQPQIPRDYRPLKNGMRFRVDILDTWNTTVTEVPGEFTLVMDDDGARAEGDAVVHLPGRPYLALRIRRADAELIDPGAE